MYAAEEMITLIKATNGTMTLEDLKNYQVTAKPPLTISFRGYKLAAVGAPASGAVTLSTLKTMEQYPQTDWADVNLTIHRYDEASRFAYGARQQLGDPDFIQDVRTLERLMLDNSMAKEIRKRILDNKTQPVKNYNPDMVYAAESHGTSHVVTADSSGMATSLTTTINLLFGAQIMTPDSGIIM
jgi:gamma-glutamyltranspeptidase / glutathione hydrolase